MQNWHGPQRIDLLLDRAIDQLGRRTPEELSRAHPETTATLEPMLQLAAELRQMGSLTMPAAAREAGRRRLRQAVQDQRRRRQFTAYLPRVTRGFAWAAASLLFVLIGASFLTRTSAQALPSDALYPIKRVSERAWLNVQPSRAGSLDVAAALAERRVAELEALAERSAIAEVAAMQQLATQLAATYAEELRLIATLEPTAQQAALAQLRAAAAEHEQRLHAATATAPSAVQAPLRVAIDASTWAQSALPNPQASPPPARIQ